MKILVGAYILILMLFLSSCRTDGVFVREIPASASDTRKAIVSVIGEPKVTSYNGRELISRYQDKSGAYEDTPKNPNERRFTRVTILGDRRPFDMQVEVVIERKSEDGVFEPVELDNALARETATKIKKALHQSLEKRNVIDNFKPF